MDKLTCSMLNPQTKKIELFYHLQDQHLIGEFFWFETQADDEDFKATDQYNSFLKASEVKKDHHFQEGGQDKRPAGQREPAGSLEEGNL